MGLLPTEAIVRLGAFAGMLALMALWETLAPRRALRLGRRRWSANLTLALLNAVIVRFAVPLGTYGAAELAVDRGWGLFNLTHGPLALEFVAAVLMMDLVVYLQHRLFHVVPFLWRFHKVHHADNDIDVTTGLRFHTVSMVFSMGVKMSAAVLLGASPLAVLVSAAVLLGAACQRDRAEPDRDVQSRQHRHSHGAGSCAPLVRRHTRHASRTSLGTHRRDDQELWLQLSVMGSNPGHLPGPTRRRPPRHDERPS